MNWFASLWKKLKDASTEGIHFDESRGNLTPRARQVLSLAQEEAGRLNHNFIGTEHLLLGLIRLGNGVAFNVLGKLHVDLKKICQEVEVRAGAVADQSPPAPSRYTPRVRRVFELAAKEATALNHAYIGTEDLLLGLLLEGEGVAARILKKCDLDPDQIRREILKELDPKISPEDKQAGEV
jgi:ATP-dependent Clp protease ATP-binding subunit ClpC